MRKTTKVLAVVFCSGVLVCGIGCGIAFAEFTSLEYTGAHSCGSENALEAQETFKASSEDRRILVDDTDWGAFSSWDFAYDESVPEGSIVFDITYDPNISGYSFNESDWESRAEYYRNTFGVGTGAYGDVVRIGAHSYRSGSADFFAVMDPFLAELREGRIGDYYYQGMTMKMRAHPSLEGRIDFLTSVMWS